MQRTLLPALAIAAASLAAAGPAAASGFATARFGGEHGNPVTPNPTSIYYNPAAIAETEGYRIFLDGSLALRGASYTHVAAPATSQCARGVTKCGDVPEPPGAEGANNGKGTLFNAVAAPMIGATAKFGDFALGAGFYVPFGGSAVWDKNEKFEGNAQYAGPVDGTQRWYAIEGTIRSMYVTLAAAYKIKPIGLSLGVSGNLIRSSIDTIRAKTAMSDNGIDLEGRLEGRSMIDVGGWQGSFGVGAMVEALPKKLWIGASYQARPNVAGGMKLKGTLRNYLVGSLTDQPVELHQDLPDIVRLGVRFAPSDKLELRLFGDWTRWSSLDRQCIADEGSPCDVADDGATSALQNQPRDWNDAFGVRAGVSFWAIPEVEIFGGVGFDSNAVPDETLEPALMDFNDLSVAAGGKFHIGRHLALALSYTHFIYFARDNAGKSQLDEFQPNSKGPDAGGEYTQWIGVINANAEVAF